MALNLTQRSSLCLGVRPTSGMPQSSSSLSMVARSGSAAQTSSNDEDACTAQGAAAPCVSTTAMPTSGVNTPGVDRLGIGDVACGQSAAGGIPADTRPPHAVPTARGLPSAAGGIPAHTAHAVPAECGLPSAAGGPPAATRHPVHAVLAACGIPSAAGGLPAATKPIPPRWAPVPLHKPVSTAAPSSGGMLNILPWPLLRTRVGTICKWLCFRRGYPIVGA